MESDLTSRVRELFAEAAEKPPEERATFLDQTCGDDATLREDVLSLLHAYEKARDLAFMA